MKVELEPTKFSKFFENFEKAIAIEKLIGSGWQREIKHHGHKSYSDGSESYDWTITYTSPSARIDLSIVEMYIDADFIQHSKASDVTMPERLERLSKDARLWRVPLLYVVEIGIEGKDVNQTKRKIDKLLSMK